MLEIIQLQIIPAKKHVEKVYGWSKGIYKGSNVCYMELCDSHGSRVVGLKSTTQDLKMAKITNRNNTFGRTKFTLKKQEDFLAELAVNGGNVTMAAKTVQTYARNVYHLAKENPDFNAAFRQAQRLGLQALEDECRRRAMKGVERAVYYQGEEVGTETLYSDTLAMFLLKGGMPEKYRDNLNVTGSVGTVQMTQEECEAFALKRMEEIRAAREAKEPE